MRQQYHSKCIPYLPFLFAGLSLARARIQCVITCTYVQCVIVYVRYACVYLYMYVIYACVYLYMCDSVQMHLHAKIQGRRRPHLVRPTRGFKIALNNCLMCTCGGVCMYVHVRVHVICVRVFKQCMIMCTCTYTCVSECYVHLRVY